MLGLSNIGFISYLIGLLWATGLLILRFDSRMYEMAEMDREQKAAQITGWTHLSLGTLLMLVTWIPKWIQ